MTTLFEIAQPRVDGYRDITPAEVAADATARVIDVREPHEYTGELGHIRGSELVPLATVEAAAKDWRRDAPLVIVCRSGARSGRAAATLRGMGFDQVMNMVGGMLAWNEAGLPVARRT